MAEKTRGDTDTQSTSYSTSALTEALNQSQTNIEAEKATLARALHDDLGGLLVGAIMDIEWIANQGELPGATKARLTRAQGLLRAAIVRKRELIENLRPTLLDNVGLFSTLRWHMKSSCEEASVPYTAAFPESEQPMTSKVRIGVFRIFQEALRDVLSSRAAVNLSLVVELLGDTLHCHLTHESTGSGIDPAEPAECLETSLHHRARSVGGTIRWDRNAGGRHMHLEVPLAIP